MDQWWWWFVLERKDFAVDCKPFQSLEVKISPIVILVDVDDSAFPDCRAFAESNTQIFLKFVFVFW